mmetsp:Transcript_121755/g.345113  ORF Transcript_121755/g.345113 Transcript_121755/m.345113 type:complete len:214 (-) Transcript_121755:439-1080(-)
MLSACPSMAEVPAASARTSAAPSASSAPAPEAPAAADDSKDSAPEAPSRTAAVKPCRARPCAAAALALTSAAAQWAAWISCAASTAVSTARPTFSVTATELRFDASQRPWAWCLTATAFARHAWMFSVRSFPCAAAAAWAAPSSREASNRRSASSAAQAWRKALSSRARLAPSRSAVRASSASRDSSYWSARSWFSWCFRARTACASSSSCVR